MSVKHCPDINTDSQNGDEIRNKRFEEVNIFKSSLNKINIVLRIYKGEF